jgi:cobalt-zinc-cadmium efflux system outer membrane protein
MHQRPHRFTVALFLILPVLCLAPPAARAQAGASRPPVQGSPLTMEQAVQLALQRNQALRAERLNIDQSKANEVTAALKPNPVLTSVNQNFPVFTPRDLTLSNLANNQTFTESLSYLFERGGKRDRRIQVARDTTEMTARTVEDAERQLRFQVTQAFISVLLAKSALDLARDDLKDFTEVVDLNRQRLLQGDLAEGDYLKISLQKLQFEQDVSAAGVALVQSRATLRQLVGYDTVQENFDAVGELARQKQAFTLEELQRQALTARPDLQAARASTRLATSSVALAEGNRARDITGEVEYDRAGPANGIGVGFSIELPVHDRNQGEIARTRTATRQAQESESAATNGVLTDVVAAFAGFQANETVVSLYEAGYLEQARQSREISTYAYRRGVGTLLDLLDAERTYRATELAYRQALAAYMTSVEQINFVVGKQVSR